MARNKRKKSWWEPIYDPTDNSKYIPFNWNLTKKIYVHHEFDASGIPNNNYRFDNVHFATCNFIGNFGVVGRITFLNCNFTYCDFGDSILENIKFSNCKFTKCSFTVCALNKIQFVNCKWENISFSGTETKIHNTSIDNPKEFIEAGYTNLDKDVLEQKSTTEHFQLMMLEQTKTKISRLIRNNLEKEGSDKAYYESTGLLLCQTIRANIFESRHIVKSRKDIYSIYHRLLLLLYPLELWVLKISGAVNNWGQSIGRPMFVGLLVLTLFAIIYYSTPCDCTAIESFLMSFDITLLVGYTKYPPKGCARSLEYIHTINVFIGIWWYSVFIPTIINRVCRAR